MSKTSSILKLLSKMSRFTHFSWVKSRLTTKASLFVLSFVKQGLQKLSTLSKYATTWFYQYLLAFVKVRLQIFHRNKKNQVLQPFVDYDQALSFYLAKMLWSFSSDSTSNPISSLQWSEFSPGTWLFCLRILLYLELRLNGAGKLLYFTPILLEIATFHPHIGSQGKDFVASGLSGLENQSCLRRRGGWWWGLLKWTWELIIITSCMDSAYLNLIKWGLHFERKRREGS